MQSRSLTFEKNLMETNLSVTAILVLPIITFIFTSNLRKETHECYIFYSTMLMQMSNLFTIYHFVSDHPDEIRA